MNLSKSELPAFISAQKKVFDTVRLVDVSLTEQYILSDNGEMVKQPYRCYAVWNKSKRCENCISAKAFALKKRLTKFEFVENEVYFVVSIYTEIDDSPYALEMVSKINDDTLFGAYGKDKFIKSLQNYNNKLYIDAMTGAYNRRYYYEQLKQLSFINAVVMLDIDHFKIINDTYGHPTGDFVLNEIVKIIFASIRECDAIVRFGGDEFLLVFQNIKLNALNERLENIKKAVFAIQSNKNPDLQVSVSMGAVYSSESAISFVELADKAMYEAKAHNSSIVIKDISDEHNC